MATRTPTRQTRPWRRAAAWTAVFRLEDEPACPEKAVAEQQSNAGQDGERRQEIEGCAGELAARHLEALDEGAEHEALGEGGNGRSVAEGMVPERPVLGIAEAELERDAPEHEGQQHDQDREVDGRNDDGEGQREGRQQPDAAHHQPGLVAVPDRSDRVHHRVARRRVGRQAIEHADAEIEAVEEDVEEDRGADDQGPDRHEIEHLRHRVPPSPALATTAPATTGASGRPPSTWASRLAASPGPRRTTRSIRRRPAGYMTR